jgi:hypothetical protein
MVVMEGLGMWKKMGARRRRRAFEEGGECQQGERTVVVALLRSHFSILMLAFLSPSSALRR